MDRVTINTQNLLTVDVQDSSNVDLLQYWVKTRVLEVYFKKGGHYKYFDISPEMFEAIASAESVGKELRSRIISNKDIKYEKIESK